MHMLRADDPLFTGFGEFYFSVVNPGVVKGWKRHQKMTQNFCVPQGMLKLVIFDDRPGSPTQGQVQEIIFGEKDYRLVRIPPGLWYGLSPADDNPVMIANCSDLPHDPQETESLPLSDQHIPYAWRKEQP